MEVGKVIYSILTGDSAVAAITPRIYGNEARQGIDLPCVVYYVISSNPQNSKSGFNAIEARVQCSCYADTYEQSIELSIAVRNALSDKPLGEYGGVTVQSIKFDGSQDFTDSAGIEGVYHNNLDFMIFYNI
jgi:hypothetical protein